MAYSGRFSVTTARFANVAFSNGSLLAGFIDRIMKRQPLSSPADVRRFFVSPAESGQICMLACKLGRTGEIYFPKLKQEQMLTFSEIGKRLLNEMGYKAAECTSEEEARKMAVERKDIDKNYPVYYFTSDTIGEKAYEEFFTDDEEISMDEFTSFGVVKNGSRRDVKEIDEVFQAFTAAFAAETTLKSDIVAIMKTFLVNFDHVEKGKNLDSKM
jgi:Predicted nucleoside-diphosphate sugar epimerases